MGPLNTVISGKCGQFKDFCWTSLIHEEVDNLNPKIEESSAVDPLPKTVFTAKGDLKMLSWDYTTLSMKNSTSVE